MPRRLHRHYGEGHLHFITSSCYHQRPLLGTLGRRNLFLEIREQVRLRYSFVVVGYVVRGKPGGETWGLGNLETLETWGLNL